MKENKKKLRLIKVVVQPVFVLEDRGELTEIEHPPVAVPAAEWPDYSKDRFPREVAEWEAKLNQAQEERKVGGSNAP